MKKNRFKRLPLIMGTVVFLLGGVDGITHGDILMGTGNLIAGLLNLVAVWYVVRAPRRTAVLLHIIDGFAAVVMLAATLLAGKHYLPYVWAMVAIMFTVAAIVTHRKGE